MKRNAKKELNLIVANANSEYFGHNNMTMKKLMRNHEFIIIKLLC